MEEIIEILNRIVPGIDTSDEARLVDEGLLDSFDIVSLVGELNETFEVTITVEDLLPENFNSANAIYALIERLKEER